MYINYEKMDLAPGTEIALTFQINDLAEIKQRQGHFSNTFPMPYTNHNTQKLQNLEDTSSNSNIPYQLLPASVIMGGVDVTPDGKSKVEESSDNYEINVFAGNFSLYDELAGKSIRSLDLSAYDHNWHFDEIVTNNGFLRDEGYVYPLTNYGRYTNENFNVDLRYLLPCFYVHTLIERIFAESTFTVSGEMLSDPFYKSLIIPIIDKEITNTRSTANNIFEIQYAGDTYIAGSDWPSGSALNFHTIISDPQNGWDDPTDTYTINTGFQGAIFAEMNIQPFLNSATDLTFKLMVNNTIADERTITQTGSFVLAANTQAFSPGDEVKVIWEGQTSSDAIIALKGTRLYTQPENTLIYGAGVNMEEVLPDISQVDLLQTVLQLFGAYIDVDARKNVRIKPLDEIIADKGLAKDWSSRVVKRKGQKLWYASKTTRIGNYGRINYMRYATDQLTPANLGSGSFSVDDETLEGRKDLFRLPFAASETLVTFGQDIAYVPRFKTNEDGDWVVEDKPKERILHRVKSLVSLTFEDADGNTQLVQKEIYVSQFIGRFSPNNLGFENSIIRDRYRGLQDVLTRAQKLNVYMRLTPEDILKLDMLLPIWLEQGGGGYYIVNKIVDYLEGELTRVELIRI